MQTTASEGEMWRKGASQHIEADAQNADSGRDRHCHRTNKVKAKAQPGTATSS